MNLTDLKEIVKRVENGEFVNYVDIYCQKNKSLPTKFDEFNTTSCKDENRKSYRIPIKTDFDFVDLRNLYGDRCIYMTYVTICNDEGKIDLSVLPLLTPQSRK